MTILYLNIVSLLCMVLCILAILCVGAKYVHCACVSVTLCCSWYSLVLCQLKILSYLVASRIELRIILSLQNVQTHTDTHLAVANNLLTGTCWLFWLSHSWWR